MKLQHCSESSGSQASRQHSETAALQESSGLQASRQHSETKPVECTFVLIVAEVPFGVARLSACVQEIVFQRVLMS